MDSIQNAILNRKSSAMDYPFHMCTRSYPTQIRHNPHPYKVRHTQGFLGLPTQTVETEDIDSRTASKTVEQFIKDSFKRGDWNYKDQRNNYIKKSKDLDSILALQYFTGLQSYSFKQDYLPYLGYREYFYDWRRKLRNLTESTYLPILEKSKNKTEVLLNVQNPNEWLNDNRLQTRSKSMYSESGRLMTRECRTNCSSSQRLKSQTIRPQSNPVNTSPNFNELDAVVFMLLSDLLQTQSVHVIQSWLSRASEREKALITSMLQVSLSRPVPDQDIDLVRKAKTAETELKPKENINECNNTSSSNNIEEADILVIEPREMENKKAVEIRPPTSSTFKPSKDISEGRSQMKEFDRHSRASVWIQDTSIIK